MQIERLPRAKFVFSARQRQFAHFQPFSNRKHVGKRSTLDYRRAFSKPIEEMRIPLTPHQGSTTGRVDGFRRAAACEFVNIKRALGFTEVEARKELAMWLGHNPHRTEVTYAYVPRR